MKRKGDWIQTYTGIHFYPLDPKVDDICIEDIAHSLSLLCRFAGHSSEFYSVAEHSLRVSKMTSLENKLWGLLHDASEAYILDLPRPFKMLEINKPYREIEDKIMKVICKKYNLHFAMPTEIKVIDTRMLVTEARDLMGNPTDWYCMQNYSPYEDTIYPFPSKHAERIFLNTFNNLIEVES